MYPTLQSPLPSPSLSSLPLPSPWLLYSTLLYSPAHTLLYSPLCYLSLASPPLPTYLLSHPYHTLAFPTLRSPHTRPLAPLPSPLTPYPTLSPTLPYSSGLYRSYPTILSPLLIFLHLLPYLPTYPRTPILPLHFLSSAPLASFPSPAPTLPYHSPPDRSRGRNVSFPTSLGYLNPSLLYPPLPYRPNTPLPCATHLLPTFPLLYPRIRSTPLTSPALIPHPTVPPFSSHLLSSPTSPYPLP